MSDLADTSVMRDGDNVTITGSGTLDLTNYKEFHNGLISASKDAEAITVDLSKADFIDTAVVQDLAIAGVALLKKGKRLKVLINKAAYPYRVLLISGFEDIMDIEEPVSQQ